MGLILGLERFPGRGHGNPLEHSCLGNPMGRGALLTVVHGIIESNTTEVTEHAYMVINGLAEETCYEGGMTDICIDR